jgi:bacterial/archaeal transporter family protein
MAAMSWPLFAALSALFASLTAIFGKIGVRDIDSNLAVAIRTSVVVVFAWGLVALQPGRMTLHGISQRSWVFLVLSGLATGASWLFYYRALQLGPASRVAPIDKLSVALTVVLAFTVLGEKPGLGSVLGGALITAGVLVAVFVP